MGNRAVITTSRSSNVEKSDDIGVYLHWNGGRDSVTAFLEYCKMKEFRCPEQDHYGWARLCQIISNYFGGDGLSIGIDTCKHIDCRNGDNGVYVIKDWDIVDRQYFNRREQDEYELKGMLYGIDEAQPLDQQLGKEKIDEYLKQKNNTEINYEIKLELEE